MQMYLHNDKHRFIKQPLMTLDPITPHQDVCTEAGAAAALWQHRVEQSAVRFKCGTHLIFCFYSKIKARLNKNKGANVFLKALRGGGYHCDADRDKPSETNSRLTFIVLGSIMKHLSFQTCIDLGKLSAASRVLGPAVCAR